jgi:hypothetical protein
MIVFAKNTFRRAQNKKNMFQFAKTLMKDAV